MTWNICYRCGYDLTGLPLPPRCPECGRFCDPATESEQAIRWYRKWWAPFALLYPKPIPSGLWFIVDEDGSLRQLARRRLLIWVWLPVVLNVVLVGSGHFIEVNYDGNIDRLYSFNLHFFGGWAASWETPWRVSMPTELDRFALIHALASLVLTCSVWVAPSWSISLESRMRGYPSNVGRFQLSLVSPLLGIICWSWFSMMACFGVATFLNWKGSSGSDWIRYSLMGVWGLLGAVAYPRIILAEKSGTLFGSRWWMATLVALISISSPVLVVLLMK